MWTSSSHGTLYTSVKTFLNSCHHENLVCMIVCLQPDIEFRNNDKNNPVEDVWVLNIYNLRYVPLLNSIMNIEFFVDTSRRNSIILHSLSLSSYRKLLGTNISFLRGLRSVNYNSVNCDFTALGHVTSC